LAMFRKLLTAAPSRQDPAELAEAEEMLQIV
jgi:hypothetical protein